MKGFFKTNQIWAITIGGVLASVIASWVLNSMPGFDGVWKSLSAGTRTGILMTSTTAAFVLLGLGVALYAGRLARIAAAQRPTVGGISAQAKLLFSPERAELVHPVAAIENLEGMIGLVPVKREVNTLIARLQLDRIRAEQGYAPEKIGMHMVFTGPPGVGKTQVASAIGAILRSLKVLRSGHLVAVDRSELVAGYVGQTAIKTMEKCREALDGILFIDEAYALAEPAGGGPDFGKEAITTVMKFMDDNRDRIIVIVAGYPDDMRRFISTNPGLAGRFTKYIDFPSYSAKDLCQIFRTMAAQQRFLLPPGFEPKVTTWINENSRIEGWANARNIRTLLETSREAQALRLVTSKGADVSRIEMVDIERAMEAR
jgi:SpoVK/Ycf46/Vps4 family AAA+-type ATPase